MISQTRSPPDPTLKKLDIWSGTQTLQHKYLTEKSQINNQYLQILKEQNEKIAGYFVNYCIFTPHIANDCKCAKFQRKQLLPK